MLEYLKKKVSKCIIVDGEKICRECGSDKVLNVALVGAVIKSGALNLSLANIDRVIEERIKERFIEMNKKALRLGYEVI